MSEATRSPGPRAGATSAARDHAAAAVHRPMRGARLVAAIYGTIVLLTVLAPLPDDEPADNLFFAVAGTAIGFWLAHVYADLLAMDVEGEERPPRARRAAMAHNWPIVAVAIPPAILALLGILDVISDRAALEWDFGLGTLSLMAWGAAAARGRGRSWPRAVLAGVGALFIGLFIAGMKQLAH